MSDSKDLPNQPSSLEPLLLALRRLADACTNDDKRMTAPPWKYSTADTEIRTEDNRPVVTGGSVGYNNALLGIDDDDAVAIVAARNRLPVLALVLRDAATRIDLLENLAIQHGAARDRLRDRVDALEGALEKACEAFESFQLARGRHVSPVRGMADDPLIVDDPLVVTLGYQKIVETLTALRAALALEKPPA